jgi:hypothetical protein
MLLVIRHNHDSLEGIIMRSFNLLINKRAETYNNLSSIDWSEIPSLFNLLGVYLTPSQEELFYCQWDKITYVNKLVKITEVLYDIKKIFEVKETHSAKLGFNACNELIDFINNNLGWIENIQIIEYKRFYS